MEDKVTILCLKCSTQIRVPVLEHLIKFKCPECSYLHYVLLGEVLPDYEEKTKKVELGEKNSEKKYFKDLFNNIIFWRFLTCFFLAFIILLIALPFKKKNEREIQDNLTTEILSKLKNSKKNDFESIKNLLTEESKNIFEIFIENQFLYNDQSSIEEIKKNINSLQPLNYKVSRLFIYSNSKNEVKYFNIEYIPNGESYLIHINIDDLIR